MRTIHELCRRSDDGVVVSAFYGPNERSRDFIKVNETWEVWVCGDPMGDYLFESSGNPPYKELYISLEKYSFEGTEGKSDFTLVTENLYNGEITRMPVREES